MVGLSWPLWLDPGDFPRVPFLPGWPGIPSAFGHAILAAMAGSMALAAAGLWWRWMIGMSLLGFAFLILGDQDRFQPWVYQYAFIALALAATPPVVAIRLGRWYAISLYLYSGLSKLDASFLTELGSTFLDAGLGLVRSSSDGWPTPVRAGAILAMPAAEIAVGVALAFRSSRRVGLIGAIGLHLTLLGVLGPWTLDQSLNVLVWNVAMIAEAWILFAGRDLESSEARGRSRFITIVFGVALVLPLGERLELCDPWPGHALYASHCRRAEVYLLDDERELYPDPIRRRLGPPGLTPWCRLDLTGWSRDVRGVPIYPGGRVASAVAEALARRYGEVRLVTSGPAHPWTGERSRDEALGRRAIVRACDRYRLNAHPAL